MLPATASALTLWSFVGKVTDPLGTPIAGATVSDGGQQTTTASDGSYSLGENSTGTYDLTAIAAHHAEQAKQVTVNLPVNTTVNFTLLYSISGTLSSQYLSTASGPVNTTLTITDWAPTTGSCVMVTDSRTGQRAAATLVTQNADGSSTWTYALSVPQGSAEGSYELSVQATSCSSGTPWSTLGTVGYMVDNTPPTISNPVPANNGNDFATPVLSFQAQDNLSGVKASSATLSLDSTTEPLTEANDGKVDLFSYRVSTTQPLGAGTHFVSASVADNAGNTASYSWTFVVSGISAPSAAVLIDPIDTVTVPSNVSLNEQVTMANVRFDIPRTQVVVESSGHAGFGLVCASVDLSSVEARFPNDLGGYDEVAPNTNPGTQSACAYTSDLTPGLFPYRNELAGWAASIGNLTFNVPATAKPGSTATLIFSGAAPMTSWNVPCYAVNATPAGTSPTYEQVCDPVPNYIEPATAGLAASDLVSRFNSFVSAGDAFQGAAVEPTVWTVSSGDYILANQPVDTNDFYASPPYAQSLTHASPYEPGEPTTSVLYSETDLYSETSNSPGTVMERYFRWDSSYHGLSGQASYLTMTWAGNYPASSWTDALFDPSGTNLSQANDSNGHAIAWTAYQPNGANNTYGSVLGIEQAFPLNGSTDQVQSGYLDETAALGCSHCTLAPMWTEDPSTSDSFSVANGGPEVSPASPQAENSCNLLTSSCDIYTVTCTAFNDCSSTQSYPPPTGSNGDFGSSVDEGTKFAPGNYLSNGSYELIMQSDGNLVQYNGNRALWASGTWCACSSSGNYATFQTDGNFVVYTSGGSALWNSHTYPYSGLTLDEQSDGNVVIYNGSSPIWNTATASNQWHCWTSNSCAAPEWSWNFLGVPPQSPYTAYGSINYFPLTVANQYAVDVWQQTEGSQCTYNPLDTTLQYDNSTACNYNNGHPVQNFRSQADGLVATNKTLWNGYYSPIINVLENPSNDPQTQCADLSNAIQQNGDPWGTAPFC